MKALDYHQLTKWPLPLSIPIFCYSFGANIPEPTKTESMNYEHADVSSSEPDPGDEDIGPKTNGSVAEEKVGVFVE